MGRFLLRRAINYLVLTFLAASAVYLLASFYLKPEINYLSQHPQPPMSSIYNILHAQNLDPRVPIFERYWHWLNDLANGSFGITYDGGSVGTEMSQRILMSTELLLVSTVIGTVTGVALGAWNALRQYRVSDRFSTIASYALMATPTPVIAVSLMTLDNWAGTPIHYIGPYDPKVHGLFPILGNSVEHLLLPTLVLVLIQTALFSRYQRSTMLDVLGSDFLRTARAKGLTRRQAVVKHGLRTAVIPVMPLLVYNVILLFTGATFTERIFGWHGMGEWLISSIQHNDVNAVAALGIFTAGLVLVAGLLSDIIFAALDPRVRA